MEQLKPCPFCGGKALGPTDAWPHMITCEECGASVKGFKYAGAGAMEAIEKWNRRATDEAAPVVHAHWIQDYFDIVCSNCEARYENDIVHMTANRQDGAVFEGLEHCPHCGAIMDEKATDCGPDYCDLEADDD